jgi:hypothetical protein
MIEEFDRVVLTRDLPEEGLEAGDAGTVMHVYDGGAGYEVEFTTLSGRTVAVATVLDGQIRAASDDDVTHARSLHRSAAS